MRRVGFGVRLRVLGPVRAISGTALFKQRYPLPANATAHPVCDLLDDVKQGVALLQAGSAREGSTLLERGAAIGRSAFGDASEFQLFVAHLLAVAAFNSGRFSVAEKQLRAVLAHVDDTSAMDRFALRCMLVNSVRAQGRLLDAAALCQAEPGDSAEQRLLVLVLRSFLLLRCKGEAPPHEPLNEAAELCAQLEPALEAKYSALVFALQGTISLEAGRFEEAQERAQKGLTVVRKWTAAGGAPSDVGLQMGDLLTVRGKALLGLKSFLSAEEVLDEALECFSAATAAPLADDVLGGREAGNPGRCAEALLALARLFKETNSLMYTEGVYRKLMSLIHQGNVDPEHRHQAYDEYAWFLRSQKRVSEAQDVENEYLRLYHKQ